MRVIGRYVWAPVAALRDGGILSLLLIAIWCMYPFAVMTVFHPADAVGFQAWMQGLAISRYVTHQAMMAGVISALVVVVALSLAQFVVTLLIYRRLGYAFATWFLALLLVGVGGNGIWWLATGYFDLNGAITGTFPLFLTIACQAACERFGMDFIFGKGVRPDLGSAF